MALKRPQVVKDVNNNSAQTEMTETRKESGLKEDQMQDEEKELIVEEKNHHSS